MRTEVKRVFPEAALERLLLALERELIEAADEEILAAAHDLGMKPEMKGSAAFLGLRYAVGPRFSDFFGPELTPQAVRRLIGERLALVRGRGSSDAPAPDAPASPGAAPRATRGTRTQRRKAARLPRPPKEPRD